jgi:hypothetical protein
MINFLSFLRDVVWSSVFATLFAIAAIVMAFIDPSSTIPLVLGSAAITSAILSTRV